MSQAMKTAAAVLALGMSMTVPMLAHAADAMRVVRDAGTGELRAPTAAEALAFERAEAQLRASRAATGGKQTPRVGGIETRYPDGTVETTLGEDSMMSSVVRSDANGNLQMECLPAKEAQKFIRSTKKPSARKAAAAKAGHDHE